MSLAALERGFAAAAAQDLSLFLGAEGHWSYARWLKAVDDADVAGVDRGDVVVAHTLATPLHIARLFALWRRGAIVALVGSTQELEQRALQTRARWVLHDGLTAVAATPSSHPLYERLRALNHAGLVLFTSGTSAAPKAAVHDLDRFLRKFTIPGKNLRTLLFMPLDHVGGLDTLLYAMARGSTVVLPRSRSVEDVCSAIAEHRVEVLPTNPSFLNLLLLSHASQTHDLSSLRVVTFGAEVMPAATLAKLASELPNVSLIQKYGSTELGALRAVSRPGAPQWLHIDEGQARTRVVDGRLQIRSDAAMLGYLDSPSPLDDEGWLATGDEVEVDGAYLRVIGRASDVINVGGEKVHPAEVEDALLRMEQVRDALVYGEKNPLLGNVVVADVVVAGDLAGAALTAAVKRHCATCLAAYKVPMRVRKVPSIDMGTHKKSRTARNDKGSGA